MYTILFLFYLNLLLHCFVAVHGPVGLCEWGITMSLDVPYTDNYDYEYIKNIIDAEILKIFTG